MSNRPAYFNLFNNFLYYKWVAVIAFQKKMNRMNLICKEEIATK